MSSDGTPRRWPRHPEDSNWPPSIKILRAQRGAHSPQADERCFTYCKQTAAGRTAGRPPVCRSICIRHVFMHELAKLANPSSAAAALLSARGPSASEDAPELEEIPLPAEGQRPGAFFAPLWPPFRSSINPKSNETDRSSGPTRASDALRAAGKAVDLDDITLDDEDHNPAVEKPGPLRTWQPGTYVWMTKSKWHALDHMNMMMFSLKAQAGWERYQGRMKEEAETRQKEAKTRFAHAMKKGAASSTVLDEKAPPTLTPEMEKRRKGGADAEPVVYEDVTLPKKDEFHPSMLRGRGRRVGGVGVPAYPDLTGQSMLVPVPPSLPDLQPAIDQLLSPAKRMVSLSVKAFHEGSYTDFGRRMYDKSFGEDWRQPWRLVGSAWKTLVRRGRNDDDDG